MSKTVTNFLDDRPRRIAQKSVSVKHINDLPSDLVLGDEIYIIDAPIDIGEGQLNITNCYGITSTNQEFNKITASGLNTDPILIFSELGSVIIERIRFENTGNRGLFDGSTTASPGSYFITNNVYFTNFKNLGSIDNVITIQFLNTLFLTWTDTLKIKNVYGLGLFDNVTVVNGASTNKPFLELSGDINKFSIVNSPEMSPQVGEAIFDIRPATQMNVVSISGVLHTAGLGEFFATVSDLNFSGISDSGTEPGVKSTVTAAGHALANGDEVKIFSDSSDYYNKGYVVSNVSAGVSFDITEVYDVTIGSIAGTYNTGSLTQADPRVTVVNCGAQSDSATIVDSGINTTEAAAPSTTFPTINTPVPIAGVFNYDKTSIERFYHAADGSVKYTGINDKTTITHFSTTVVKGTGGNDHVYTLVPVLYNKSIRLVSSISDAGGGNIDIVFNTPHGMDALDMHGDVTRFILRNMTDASYDGVYSILTIVDETTVRVTHAFTATATGEWGLFLSNDSKAFELDLATPLDISAFGTVRLCTGDIYQMYAECNEVTLASVKFYSVKNILTAQ